MTRNGRFAEQANIIAAAPLDMATTGGISTGYVSLKNYDRATVVLIKNAAGSGTEHPVITLTQATAVAGTGAKNLSTVAVISRKVHATALAGIGTWTDATQTAGATFTGVATEQAIYAFEVHPEDLDIAGGFDCVQAAVADVGSVAQLGCLFILLWNSRYNPPLSPLVN
jgi:hypothetical protein